MDKYLTYLCKACGTFDKVKPNLMNFITQGGILIFLLLATIGTLIAQPCDTPSNVYIETIDFNTIDISWDEVNNSSYYEVEYKNVETFDTETLSLTTTSTTIDDIPGGTYEFSIITHCIDGSLNIGFAIIHVIADDLEGVEDLCYECYQKFKDCELLNGYEDCDCYQLCESDACCDFVTSGLVLITPPSIKECDCELICGKSNCCKYIDGDTGAMPIKCEDCADEVRTCNESIKLKSNKTTVPLIRKEVCSIEAMYPNPFKNELQLSFELQYSTFVEFAIYDSKGQEISRLSNNERKEKGKYDYSLKTNNWNKGIYYSILRTRDGCEAIQKMLKIE